MIGRRKPHRDPVTPETHQLVIERDIRYAGGCVAAFLDPTHGCRDRWGEPHEPTVRLTLDHVHTGYGMMGKRAPSDPAHLLSLCWFGHLGGWGTAHKDASRWYLEKVERERAA